MAKLDEISSTEKLLRLIRSKGSQSDAVNSPPDSTSDKKPVQQKKPKQKKASRKKQISKRAALAIGMDFGKNAVRLAAITEKGEKKPHLVHYATYEYEKGLSISHPRMPVFVKSILDDFCGAQRKVDIWLTIPSTNVDAKYLRIPKVSRKQLTTTVLWSHRRENRFDERESIFDYHPLGSTVEDGIEKLEVISYTAPKRDVENLQKLFAKAGYPLAGISIVPFALQNLFRTGWTETGGQSVCTLFIGTDWSRITIFNDNKLILSRDIKAGMQSMVEAVADGMEKKHPEFSLPLEENTALTLAQETGENNSPYTEMARRLLDGFIEENVSEIAEEVGTDAGEDEIFQMISPALDRIVRQVERTLDHYHLNYQSDRINRLYLTGPICSHERLVRYIDEQLGLPVDFIDPFYTEMPGAVEVEIPESVSDRGKYLPAIGMAMAHNDYTPNFMYTYEDKERLAKIDRFNRAVFGVSIVLMLICVGYFAWQTGRLDRKKEQVVKLEQQLERFIPNVDQSMILQLATESVSDRRSVDNYAEKYKGMALISEIVKITPKNIRLAGIALQLGGLEAQKGDEPAPEKTMRMDGVVSGDRINFESVLAGYMVKLERSPMFGRPEILKQSFEIVEEKEVMKFQAKVNIL